VLQVLHEVIGMAARAGMHRCAFAGKNIPAQTARLMFWVNVQLISS
jgi:hypothetical protein